MKKDACHSILLFQGTFLDHERDLINVEGYQIKELKNSAKFNIGQILDKDAVEKLCDSPYWTVTIREYSGR